MYTPFATRRLVRLDDARSRRIARELGSLWHGHEGINPMADAPRDRVQELREQSRRGLQFLMNTLLTNAEQALLGMAGKARNNAEQAQYYDAIRELRLKSRGLEERFMSKVLAGFDAIREPVAAPPPQAPSKTGPPKLEMHLDGLDVVKDTMLEEQLAIENIASRARHQHRDALLALGQNISRELGIRRIEVDVLPTGPQALSRAFMDSCSESHIEPRSRILFSRLFTRFVIDELAGFYAQGLAVFPPPEEAAARAEASAATAVRTATAHDLPTGQHNDDEFDPGAAAAAARLDMGWDSSRTPLLAPPGKAMAIPRTLIDEVLGIVQEELLEPGRAAAMLNPKAGIQPLDMYELVNETLSGLGHTRAMALPADVVETVNLVRMLFEHALRDVRVPAQIRRLVRLLQVPLLRATLREPDALTAMDHPARALFKEIAASAIGWSPQGEPADDDYYRLVQLLVTRILSDYEKDAVVFANCLEDLRRYVRAREAPVRMEQTRTLVAETGRAEAQAARAAISELVGSAAEGASLPRAVSEFLRGAWSDALFVIRLRDGESSPEWGLAVETTGRLVAAARNPQPGGLAVVAQGLARALLRAGTDESAAREKIRVLEVAMAGADGVAPDTGPAKPVAAAVPRPDAAPEFLLLVDKLAPDTWVEFREPGGVRRRAKLLTKIPRTGQFLFVNDDGAKAGDFNRNDLASMIEQGEAMVLHGAPTGGGSPAPGRFGRR